MKASTSGQREKAVGLLLISSFFLMMVLAVVSFVYGLKAPIDRRARYMTDDAVAQYSKDFTDAVNNKLTATLTIADILGTVSRGDNNQLYSILDKAANGESFQMVALSNLDGDTTTIGGGMSENVSEQDCFQKALGGETVVSYLDKSTTGNDDILLMTVPVRSGTEITGVLSCGYGLAELEHLIHTSRYFGEAYMMVYTGDYSVITWQQHRNTLSGGSDLAHIFEYAKMLGGMSSEQLRSNMQTRMCGSFSMEYLGERRLVSYAPVGINDWYAFCYSPFTVYNNDAAEVAGTVLLFITELGLALALLSYYVLRINRRHSKMIDAANVKYEAIISNICGGVQVTTLVKKLEEMEIVYLSTGFTEMTGYTYDDIITLWGGKIYHYIYEKDIPSVNSLLQAVTEDSKAYDMEYRIVCRDGHIVWVVDRGKIIENEEGIRQFQSVLTDISTIKEHRDMLAISEERFRIAVESADNIMFDYDSVNCTYLDFANSERMLGKTTEQINRDLAHVRNLDEPARTAEIGKYFYHPDDFDNVMKQSLIALKNGEVYFDARVLTVTDCIWCRVHLTVKSDEDGRPYRVLGFLGNIDVVKRQAELFRVRSEKDALTGFYNKAATISLVNDALSNSADIPHTLFVMDIDNFKTINDTLGHIAGDAVIAEVAERTRAIFRSDDILGRVGGDEFIVLIRGVSDVDHITRKANEITQAFSTMSINAGEFFSASISIGIEICTAHSNYEESFIRADKALYQAKRLGKNQYIFYDKALSNSNCYTCNDIGGTQEK